MKSFTFKTIFRYDKHFFFLEQIYLILFVNSEIKSLFKIYNLVAFSIFWSLLNHGPIPRTHFYTLQIIDMPESSHSSFFILCHLLKSLKLFVIC